MPFTFAHPALVLPLARLPQRWISMTGLIVGSMTPDFEYFIRMKISSHYSHTLAGLFYFDLPLGFLLTFLFHLVIRDQLIDNLPLVIKQRAVSIRNFDWLFYFRRHWLVVMLSLILGAFSHLLWDSFTHENGFFVKAMPYLRTPSVFLGIHLEYYRVLQHASTVVGLGLIAVAFAKLPADHSVSPKASLRYWAGVVMMAVIITVIRTAIRPNDFAYSQIIVTVISAGIISLSLAPLLSGLSDRSNRRE